MRQKKRKKQRKSRSKKIKIALTHDYLREYGGAERVLEALHELYPEAPVYVAFVDQKNLGIHWDTFSDWDIRQSWLTKIPFYKKIYSPLRILAPRFFCSFDFSEYDVVISSSNMYFAKAITKERSKKSQKNKKKLTGKKKKPIHISYCHTPPRSLYGYNTMTNWKKNPLIRVAGSVMNHYLRVVDYYVSQEVDYFIANSQEVQQRIWKFYRRDSKVLYPPVELLDFSVPHERGKSETKSKKKNLLDHRGTSNQKVVASGNRSAKERGMKKNTLDSESYFLYVGRLAFAKHPELAVAACNRLKLPLKVVGSGGMQSQLEQKAGPSVEIMGAVDDQQLAELYAGAKALLYPVEDEDFGIVPVEAMGYGVPVIAHRSGGPVETITDDTGLFFDEIDVKSLINAIKTFQKKDKQKKFNRSKIQKHAQQFSKKVFVKSIDSFVRRKSFENSKKKR